MSSECVTLTRDATFHTKCKERGTPVKTIILEKGTTVSQVIEETESGTYLILYKHIDGEKFIRSRVIKWS